jgi:hypothetical protein
VISLATIAPQLLLAFSGALFGALLGGAVSWSRARRERRLKLTLDLYAEFHTPVMNHVRIAAHEALAGRAGVPSAYASAQGEAKDSIASIVHFWEKVALLLRIQALDERLVRRFLGQYAVWWRDTLCNARALEDAEWGATLREIDWLFARITRKATALPRR